MSHSHRQQTLVKRVSPVQAAKATFRRALPGAQHSALLVRKYFVQIHRLTPDGCSNPFRSKHKRKTDISSRLCNHPPTKTSHFSENAQPRVPGPAAPVLLSQSSSTAKK